MDLENSQKIIEPDQKKLEPFSFIDGNDNELVDQRMQLISQNQGMDERDGHFLIMDLDNETHPVTTCGRRKDAASNWQVFYTLNNSFEQTTILKNIEMSRRRGRVCVLATQHNPTTDNYELCAKELSKLPTRLVDMDPTVTFYKKSKGPGSEMIYLESAIRVSGKRLLVGFGSNGLPLPMEQVKEFSYESEPYFKIIGYSQA